jgi:hypothetical protein
MGVHEITLDFVQSGKTPQEISEIQRVSIKTTYAYIDQLIGEGRLRRSEVYFRVSPEKRHFVENYASGAYADLYEDLAEIERILHGRIRRKLEELGGPSDNGWWRAVPEEVRVKLQERRERDPNPERDAYAYTDLLDLADILNKQWNAIAQSVLSPEARADKGKFLKDFRQLNDLRKKVMHPVRYSRPSDADFEFLEALRPKLVPRP